MAGEMSVARTWPVGPTRRAAARLCPPAPAATSRTRLPAVTPAASSIRSVVWPSQSSMAGPQRCHASAASSHWARVVVLYCRGSNVVELPTLGLVGGPAAPHQPSPTSSDAVLDRAALLAYRRRLAELDDDIATAHDTSDLGRQRHAIEEREHLLAELRRATRPDGSSRTLGS